MKKEINNIKNEGQGYREVIYVLDGVSSGIKSAKTEKGGRLERPGDICSRFGRRIKVLGREWCSGCKWVRPGRSCRCRAHSAHSPLTTSSFACSHLQQQHRTLPATLPLPGHRVKLRHCDKNGTPSRPKKAGVKKRVGSFSSCRVWEEFRSYLHCRCRTASLTDGFFFFFFFLSLASGPPEKRRGG